MARILNQAGDTTTGEIGRRLQAVAEVGKTSEIPESSTAEAGKASKQLNLNQLLGAGDAECLGTWEHRKI